MHVIDIKEKACQQFSLDVPVPKVSIKLWDRGFEDWVDLDDDNEELENNSKVCVSLAEAETATGTCNSKAENIQTPCNSVSVLSLR